MSDASRYRADIDFRNVNDSHTFAIACVPARSKVLDVGAADGSVAHVLQRMGCRVWGIEMDPVAAASARQWCEDVVVTDLNSTSLSSALDEKFDVILFLDILEHLQDPLAVLRDGMSLLAPRGHVVISLPNIAHGSARAQLLAGRFSYTDAGLLDRTHLRFFDPVSVRQLLFDAGLTVIDESEVTFPLDATEIPIDRERVDDDVLSVLAHDPASSTYQFLFMAAPTGSDLIADPPVLPARILQEQLRSLQFRSDLVRIHRQELEEKLRSLRIQSETRRTALRTLLGSVRANAERLAGELDRTLR